MSRSKTKGSLLLAATIFLMHAVSSAQNCAPEITTSSLLNNVSVEGSLYIGKMYGKCLPMPSKKSKTNYEYNPYDGGKLSTTLKNSAGQTLNTFVWYGEHILGLWEMNRYEVVGGGEALKKLTPGNYTLEFALEDKVFQKFPFAVATKDSGDQFRPQTLYMLDGQWRDYAQIYAPNVNRFIKLYVWLRNPAAAGGPNTPPVPVRGRLIREKDKQVLAETDDPYKLNLTHKWVSIDLPFRKPGGLQAKPYVEFKLSDVTAVDGRYRFELTVDGKPYSNYEFTVAGGRINDIDLADMQKKEYKIFIPLTASKPR